MNKFFKFFAEAKTELQKVSWPTPLQALNMTLAVVGVSLVFALYIAGIDFIIVEGVKWITSFAGKQQTTESPQINPIDVQATPSGQ